MGLGSRLRLNPVRTIGTFTIGPPPHVPSDGDAKAKLKVKVRPSM